MAASAAAGPAGHVRTSGARLDMQTARLELDGRGRLAAWVDAVTGRDVARPGAPFCRLQTAAGAIDPAAVTQAGNTVSFAFPGDITLVYRVTPGDGFSVWEVADIRGIELAEVQSLRLCDLNVTGFPTLRPQLNAVSGEDGTVAVLSTHLNVRPSSIAGANRGGNLARVS